MYLEVENALVPLILSVYGLCKVYIWVGVPHFVLQVLQLVLSR